MGVQETLAQHPKVFKELDWVVKFSSVLREFFVNVGPKITFSRDSRFQMRPIEQANEIGASTAFVGGGL